MADLESYDVNASNIDSFKDLVISAVNSDSNPDRVGIMNYGLQLICNRTQAAMVNYEKQIEDLKKDFEKEKLKLKTTSDNDLTELRKSNLMLKASNKQLTTEKQQLVTDLKRLQDDMDQAATLNDSQRIESTKIKEFKDKLKIQFDLIKKFNYERIKYVDELNNIADEALINFKVRRPDPDPIAQQNDYEKEMNRLLKIKIEIFKVISSDFFLKKNQIK